MNQYLKYFIYFLLGVIIYYFLFNSTGGRKVIEGFDAAGNIADYFNIRDNAIYINNIKTGIGENTVGTYVKNGALIQKQLANSTFKYADLTFADRGDIGYTFRPDIYKFLTLDQINTLGELLEKYQAGGENDDIKKFYPLKLNVEQIEPPGSISCLVSDSLNDDDATPISSAEGVVTLNIVPIPDITDWLTLLDSGNENNVILYREATGLTDDSTGVLTEEQQEIQLYPLEILIEFSNINIPADADQNISAYDGINFKEKVNVHFKNIVKYIGRSGRIGVFPSVDVNNANTFGDEFLGEFANMTLDELVDVLEADASATNVPKKYSVGNLTQDVTDAGTSPRTANYHRLAGRQSFYDFYNYIDSATTIGETKLPLIIRSRIISDVESTAIDKIPSIDALRTVQLSALRRIRDTSFRIFVNIFNVEKTPVTPSWALGDVDVMSNVDSTFTGLEARYTESDLHPIVAGLTDATTDNFVLPDPTILQAMIEADGQLEFGGVNLVSGAVSGADQVKFNLFIILKLFQEPTGDTEQGVIDIIGDLESALLLTMRSIGTTPDGRISSNEGCAAAGDSLCTNFNLNPIYKYKKYAPRYSDKSPEFFTCDPHTPGTGLGYLLNSGGPNCHVDPDICCISTQCSQILREYPEYCSSKNKHNNPYGNCAEIAIQDKTIHTIAADGGCTNCCGMDIHSAITNLFYNINNFNYNNNASEETSTGVSRTMISRNNIRNFMYGELIKSIDIPVSPDTVAFKWPPMNTVDPLEQIQTKINKDIKKYHEMRDVIEAENEINDEKEFLQKEGFEELSKYFNTIFNGKLEYRPVDTSELVYYNDTGVNDITSETNILILNNNKEGIMNLLNRIVLTISTDDINALNDGSADDHKTVLNSFISTNIKGPSGGPSEGTYEHNFDAIYDGGDNLAGKVGVALNVRSGTDVTLNTIKEKYKHFMDNWGKSIPHSERNMENEIKLSLILLDTIPPVEVTGTTGLSPLKMAFSEDYYNTSTFAILL